MKFVDVTNDVAFRKIFGSSGKKKSLISLLRALVRLPEGREIADVTIIDPYQFPKLDRGRSTIVDVKAKDQDGNTFIIEMQVSQVRTFEKKVLYYTSQAYVGQMKKGEAYEKLSPAYFVGILQFRLGNNPGYLSHHQIRDVETGEHILRDMQFTFLELPKFQKRLHELEGITDQWAYFFKNAPNLTVEPDGINDEGLMEAYNQAAEHNWGRREMDNYIRANLRKQDDKGKIKFAVEKAIKETEEKALEKTKLEVEKAVKETEEKAKLEVKKAVKETEEKAKLEVEKSVKDTKENVLKGTAKQMLDEGIDLEIISRITGLGIETIKGLLWN